MFLRDNASAIVALMGIGLLLIYFTIVWYVSRFPHLTDIMKMSITWSSGRSSDDDKPQ